MTLLRPAPIAATWLFFVGCAVGSGAIAEDGALSPLPSRDAAAPLDGGDGHANDEPPAPTVGSDAPLEPPGADAAADVATIALDADAQGALSDAAPLGPSDLLYFYPFDGDATDASGHGNDGTAHAVQYVADRGGRPGRAARFDGAQSFVFAPGVLVPLGARERTVTAWVKPASSPPPGLYANALVAWGSGDCVGQMWGLGDVSDAVLVWTGCNDQQTHAALPRDVWTFVALRFTAPTSVRVWVGASSVDVTLAVAPRTAASLLWIGAETTTNEASAIRRYFAGDIDSVRVYGRALGDAEVAAVSALP